MDAHSFISRWQSADGTELANAQSFVKELCELLGVEHPLPSQADTNLNAYTFERSVQFKHRNGDSTPGRIDCYKRGAFVLEAKSIAAAEATRGWDTKMERALNQARGYVHALPADEGRPPFIVLLDVNGGLIELYSEFSRSGGQYIPFPDPRAWRIRLKDLADEAIRERLHAVWTDP
ncbi:MAG: type IIL restriction-modification enzyme MmeI, partial [Gammaproteobacteria bacterium]